MAPLDFTVDYNDATLESAGTPSTPEVSLSNRTTAVDVASLAVLGAGSDAVELYFVNVTTIKCFVFRLIFCRNK